VARQGETLSPTLSFPDLTTIVERQCEVRLFFGGRANKCKDVAAQHLYARGMSVGTAASDSRSTKKPATGWKRKFKPYSNYVEATTLFDKDVLSSLMVLHSVRNRSETVVKLYLDRLQGKGFR
jgi:hypothetical protein